LDAFARRLVERDPPARLERPAARRRPVERDDHALRNRPGDRPNLRLGPVVPLAQPEPRREPVAHADRLVARLGRAGHCMRAEVERVAQPEPARRPAPRAEERDQRAELGPRPDPRAPVQMPPRAAPRRARKNAISVPSSASDRIPGPTSKCSRASFQWLPRRSWPEAVVATEVENSALTPASRPSASG